MKHWLFCLTTLMFTSVNTATAQTGLDSDETGLDMQLLSPLLLDSRRWKDFFPVCVQTMLEKKWSFTVEHANDTCACFSLQYDYVFHKDMSYVTYQWEGLLTVAFENLPEDLQASLKHNAYYCQELELSADFNDPPLFLEFISLRRNELINR